MRRAEPGRRVLGRYVVGTLLGAGAMGEVYRGTHEALGFQVALKVISGRADSMLITRHAREARAMARVRHPNVVAVRDLGVLDDGRPCIVMELVGGESLQQRLDRDGTLPWPLAVELVVGAAAGLGAVHAAGIVHRDIKPDNLLLEAAPAERLRIADFGLANLLDEARLTRTGLTFGTPAYMAPEQLDTSRVDHRADLFSLGLVLYRALTGVIPGEQAGVMAPMWRLLNDIPRPAAPPHQPAVPGPVERALQAALAPDPADRPADCAELVRRLREPGPPEVQPWRSTRSVERVRGDTSTAPEITVRGSQSLPTVSGSTRVVLLAAQLPPSRLTSPDERRWLAALATDGRSFTIGALLWVAVLPAASAEAGQARADAITGKLAERHGGLARCRTSLATEPVALTPAMLTGAAPLPPALRELIESLAADKVGEHPGSPSTS